MMKSCKYCGRVHNAGTVCPKKPKRKNKWGYDRGRVGVFRGGPEWKACREKVLDRDYHLCRLCECMEFGTFAGQRYNSHGLSVHHIVPLAEDWERRTDEDNLITVCSWHHEMAESGKISREKLFEIVRTPLKF